MLNMFQKLQQEASLLLLFLRNVKRITFYRYLAAAPATAAAPSLVFKVELLGVSGALEQERKRIATFIHSHMAEHSASSGRCGMISLNEKLLSMKAEEMPTSVYFMTTREESGTIVTKREWCIADILRAGNAAKLAVEEDTCLYLATLRLIPRVTVAAELTTLTEKYPSRIFCTLPLPGVSGLPIHINGCFELSDNRRELWCGDDMSGKGKLRSDWNQLLLSELVPVAYLLCLNHLRRYQYESPAAYYSFFPEAEAVQPCFRKSVCDEFYALFAAQHEALQLPSLQCSQDGEADVWFSIKEAAFPPVDNDLPEEINCALLAAGGSLVGPPMYVIQSLAKAAKLQHVSPAFVRGQLQTGFAEKVSMEIVKNKRTCLALLWYASLDEEFEALEGLPLLWDESRSTPAVLCSRSSKTLYAPHEDNEGSENISFLFDISAKLGCQLCILPTKEMALRTLPVALLRRFMHQFTAPGLVRAVHSAGSGAIPTGALTPEESQLLQSFLLQTRWFDNGGHHYSKADIALLQALPLFATISIDSTLGALPKGADVAPEELNPKFRDLNLDKLYSLPSGVAHHFECNHLVAAEVYLRHVVPFLQQTHDLPCETVDAVMVILLDEVLRAHGQLGADLVGSLQDLPCIRMGCVSASCKSTELRAANQMLDPNCPEVLGLFSSGERLSCHCGGLLPSHVLGFPVSIPFRSKTAMLALSMLGLRSKLSKFQIVSRAKYLSQQAPSDGRNTGCIALLEYLALESEFTLPPGGLRTCDAHTDNSMDYYTFRKQLCEIRWLPTLSRPEDHILPWLADGKLDLSCASETRQYCDYLVVSASTCILQRADNAKSPLSAPLSDFFGWNSGIAVSIVCTQLAQAIVVFGKGTQDASVMHAIEQTTCAIYSWLEQADQTTRSEFRSQMEDGGLGDWLWTGGCFVAPCQLAFRDDCPLHLEPFLFNIRPEHASKFRYTFGEAGVVDVFTVETIAQILPQIGGVGQQLNEQDLAHYLGILSFVADNEGLSIAPGTFPVPCTTGVLVDSTLCFFNDAPWLQDCEASKDVIFSHPKVSPELSMRLGLQSVIQQLVKPEQLVNEAEWNQQSQQFGQYEPLTTRLKNLLRENPDDGSLLKELVQNAEDAGAKHFKLMYDMRDHGKESLLNPRMATWQGPALLAYNDSTFTANDFGNICRLGAETKLKEVSKIGRYGVGFNCVYHLTDLPSIVTGEHVAFLDPHQLFLPQQSKGSKMKFHEHKLQERFSDQFAPYRDVFGCNLGTTSFPGTLFRFPLRSEAQAKTSEISSKAWDQEKRVFELLDNFKIQAPSLFCFLQNLQTIEIHVWESGKDRPVSVFSSKVKTKDSRDYLPKPAEEPVHMDITSRDIGVKGGAPWTDQWIVCHSNGGALIHDLSKSERASGKHLHPYAGVAALISSADGPCFKGQAFCFLPLPILTALPVHVNGYFALSSNRRFVLLLLCSNL
jgi:hypothetical protein